MSVLVQWLMVACITSGIGAWRVSGTRIPWIRAIFEEDGHAYISNRGQKGWWLNVNMARLALARFSKTCKKKKKTLCYELSRVSEWSILKCGWEFRKRFSVNSLIVIGLSLQYSMCVFYAKWPAFLCIDPNWVWELLPRDNLAFHVHDCV